MKKVTFVSHYFCKDVNILLTDEKYDKLMHNQFYYPLELYNMDADRVYYGIPPTIFSVYQISKLHNAILGTEYWDKII